MGIGGELFVVDRCCLSIGRYLDSDAVGVCVLAGFSPSRHPFLPPSQAVSPPLLSPLARSLAFCCLLPSSLPPDLHLSPPRAVSPPLLSLYLTQVAANSAAERGGLRVGDILTEIDGYDLTAETSSGKRGGAATDGSSDAGGDLGSNMVRTAKELIVGPRGARVLIKGTRQHFLGAREPFQTSILRI